MLKLRRLKSVESVQAYEVFIRVWEGFKIYINNKIDKMLLLHRFSPIAGVSGT